VCAGLRRTLADVFSSALISSSSYREGCQHHLHRAPGPSPPPASHITTFFFTTGLRNFTSGRPTCALVGILISLLPAAETCTTTALCPITVLLLHWFGRRAGMRIFVLCRSCASLNAWHRGVGQRTCCWRQQDWCVNRGLLLAYPGALLPWLRFRAVPTRDVLYQRAADVERSIWIASVVPCCALTRRFAIISACSSVAARCWQYTLLPLSGGLSLPAVVTYADSATPERGSGA